MFSSLRAGTQKSKLFLHGRVFLEKISVFYYTSSPLQDNLIKRRRVRVGVGLSTLWLILATLAQNNSQNGAKESEV